VKVARAQDETVRAADGRGRERGAVKVFAGQAGAASRGYCGMRGEVYPGGAKCQCGFCGFFLTKREKLAVDCLTLCPPPLKLTAKPR
jgi:hypothetical protein